MYSDWSALRDVRLKKVPCEATVAHVSVQIRENFNFCTVHVGTVSATDLLNI